MSRFLKAGAVFALMILSSPALAETLRGVLYKSPYCTCCEGHADYLRSNDVTLEIKETEELEKISRGSGIPPDKQGCHTILLQGYAFEGHITVDIMRRFLKDPPADVVGLALPGMPPGVPGMGGEKSGSYDVYAIRKDGTATVFATQ